MAESLDISQSDEVVDFVTDTEPVDKTDYTEYAVLDLQLGHSFNISRETTETRNKRTTTTAVGQGVETRSYSCHRSRVAADGQDIVRSAMRATTPPVLWFLTRPKATGEQGEHFKGRISSASGQNQTANAETLDFEVGIDGPVTEFTTSTTIA